MNVLDTLIGMKLAEDAEPVLLYYNHDGSVLLYTEVLASGGDGAYDGTPERADTAQYAYTFAGWALEPNGEADSDARKSVRKNRKVYAAYTAAVRTYTVRLYNGSTLLQTESNVPYGSSVTYTGETPVKTGVTDPTIYEFIGWSLTPDGPASAGALTDISGDRDVYAAYKINAEAEYQDSSGVSKLDTLAGAVKNAPSGATIYLIADVALKETLTVKQTALTLDSKDAGVVYTISPASDGVGLTASGKQLAVKNLNVTAPITVASGGSLEESGATLAAVTFQGAVTFGENGVSTSFVTDRTYGDTGVKYYEAALTFRNSVSIAGGVFTGLAVNSNSTVEISGGTFVKSIPWTNYYGYIQSGYGVYWDSAAGTWSVVDSENANLSTTKNDNTVAYVYQKYTVSGGRTEEGYIFYSDLQNAVDNAVDKDDNQSPVYLWSDVVLDKPVYVNNDAQIIGYNKTVMANNGEETTFGGDSLFVVKAGTTLRTQNVKINGSGKARGVEVGENASLTMSFTPIQNGSADKGGAIYAASGSSVTISSSSSDINGNNATEKGGAIYFDGATLSLTSGVRIRTNTADEAGGGLYVNSGSASMNSGSITGNTAGAGAAAYVRAVAALNVSSTTTISGNTSTGGGPEVFVEEGGVYTQ